MKLITETSRTKGTGVGTHVDAELRIHMELSIADMLEQLGIDKFSEAYVDDLTGELVVKGYITTFS